eukprot:2840441-Prymnesium_polylepis.1
MMAFRTTECFVCCEDGDEEPVLTNLCLCSDRALHLGCQRRLLKEVEASQGGVCAVCRAPYSNVVQTRRVNTLGALLYASLLAALVLLFSWQLHAFLWMPTDLIALHQQRSEALAPFVAFYALVALGCGFVFCAVQLVAACRPPMRAEARMPSSVEAPRSRPTVTRAAVRAASAAVRSCVRDTARSSSARCFRTARTGCKCHGGVWVGE